MKPSSAARKGLAKRLLVLFDEGGARRVFVGRGFDRLLVDDVDRATGAHHGDFGVREGKVHVRADVLAAHHVVRAAVGFARDDGELRHGGFAEGVQQLGAVADDAAVFLVDARQEAWHVHEGHERDVETVAKAHEARGFRAGVDVEHAGQYRGLIGHDADHAAADAREAGQDVARELLVRFQQ